MKFAAKSRDPFCFRTQCLLSTTSPPTSTAANTMLDMETMRLLSLTTHSNAAAADRLWTCIGTIRPLTEVRIALLKSLNKYNLNVLDKCGTYCFSCTSYFVPLLVILW